MPLDLDKVQKLLDIADAMRDHTNLPAIKELIVRDLKDVEEEAEKEVEEIHKKEQEERDRLEAEKAAQLRKEREDAERHSEGVRAGGTQATGAEGDVRRRYP